jgi:hypothetical protein
MYGYIAELASPKVKIEYGSWALHAEYLRLRTHTLTICNTYCFSTTIMVMRTRHNITSYSHCLSCIAPASSANMLPEIYYDFLLPNNHLYVMNIIVTMLQFKASFSVVEGVSLRAPTLFSVLYHWTVHFVHSVNNTLNICVEIQISHFLPY